jgi:hypothetical protein
VIEIGKKGAGPSLMRQLPPYWSKLPSLLTMRTLKCFIAWTTGISLKWTLQETLSGLRRDLFKRYTLQVGSHLRRIFSWRSD